MSARISSKEISSKEVERLFAACFSGTQLIGGATEPLYLPATDARHEAELYYREDFVASALHETSHWCIAGDARRGLVDFGYSYLPPPRTAQQQSAFFELELKTQALECIFARAIGCEFQVSADNLDADAKEFSRQIAEQVPIQMQWLETQAGARARVFRECLVAYQPTKENTDSESNSSEVTSSIA